MLALLASGLVAGCGFQIYSPKPIDPAQSVARYQAHDVNSAEFNNYLISQGYARDQLPIKKWDLRELTLSALFFHPELDVARAKWRAAQAAEITAGQRRQVPGISGNIERHSQHSGGISPWSYGLSINIPIETGNKRQARIDQAKNLSEAARIEIAQTAWQVRSRLADSLIDYHASLQQTQILRQEVTLRSEIVAMLEARLNVGLISNTEISNGRLQLQKIQQALEAEKGRAPQLLAALASNAGLSVYAFSQLNLASSVTQSAAVPLQSDKDIQQAALLNRLDIRAALARYDATEAKLRLEIARQYPDITLSPGYSFDQGDRIWSLGLSTLLALLTGNKNEGLIAEARALREVEGAQFEALQAKIIGETSQSKAQYDAAVNQLEKAKVLQASQLARTEQTRHQFDIGLVDRLELTTAKLENLAYVAQVFSAEQKLKRAAQAIENIMQRPLDNSEYPVALGLITGPNTELKDIPQ